MINNYEFWFITGSQYLYGDAVLQKVLEDSNEIVKYLNSNMGSKYKIVCKCIVKTKEEINNIILEANHDKSCAGVITWMHTFSPSKMWINGMKMLQKPILHFHTQFNKEIPWETIDMDFMNTNQSAHGDREHGFIHTRMNINRKIIVGHYKNEKVLKDLKKWMRVAAAVQCSKELKIARFGDNMRSVAVTEGDKVEAEIKFGWSVDYYGVGDLVDYVDRISKDEVDLLVNSMMKEYKVDEDVFNNDKKMDSIRYQAKLELGIQKFLDENNYICFTNTFEDLHGLEQLPGLASQRLMSKGYGFGPEGDWKVAALVGLVKNMSDNIGTSLMEDYTYHLEAGNECILGSHMLEVCPTIAKDKPCIEVHPLDIGGKNPPARLVFEGHKGTGICVSLVDLGGRFRLIVADVEAVEIKESMSNLHVARVMWKPLPDFETGVKAWIYAGGAHHTVFSYEVDAEDIKDFARMMDIECVHISKDTDINKFERELMINNYIWGKR